MSTFVERVARIAWPDALERADGLRTRINMMPIRKGDASTYPPAVARYAALIDACAFADGDGGGHREQQGGEDRA